MKFRSALSALGATLICSVPLLAAPASNTSANDTAVLARYQLALDQLSTGNVTSARIVLEDGIKRFGPQNDLNLLLGYVLQREGKNSVALDRLSQAPSSTLAVTFANQLRNSNTLTTAVQGTPMVMPVAATAPVNAVSGAALSQTDARLAKLEVEMVAMVNEERARAGLKTLTINSNLASVARAHSAEMRDKDYFAHESPTTGLREPIDRYQSALNDRPRVIAENIFRSWGAQRQVTLNEIKEGHTSLMKSPGHRANILYPDVSQIGIGIVANSRGDIWITQMFLRP
jgi:uncharacterized protein YkwD